MRTVRFTVKGRGPFPLDMLRYASAWPASSIDAAEMDRDRPIRAVTLETDRGGPKRCPVHYSVCDRFKSFGWTVTTADGMDLHPTAGWFDPSKEDDGDAVGAMMGRNQ